MQKPYRNQTDDIIDAIRQGFGGLGHGIEGITKIPANRVRSLTDGKELASGTIIEAVGIPVYVDDVTDYSAYGLTETGWYVFARITAEPGTLVTSGTAVTGTAGCVAQTGTDHVDVAVRFDVAAQSQVVTVAWGTYTDAFVFKATDLAVRNLDYRTTFYIYDLAPYVTWSYGFTADTAFAAGKNYYTEAAGVYTLAEVETVAYVLTEDETFSDTKTYYTKDGSEYTAAEVTAGEAVTAGTYYEATTVPVPAYYVDGYKLTTDTTFQDGTTYYTLSDGEYIEAEVTTGEAVTAGTYYVAGKVQTAGTFAEDETYYTLSGSTYSEAEVTAGEAIPAYYEHTKITIQGMARNVTYALDEIIDCPMEFILPEVEDATHGCWYEMRFRHAGEYSMTLTPPDSSVKIATEHTQKETAGINMIDLHYTCIDGVKLWRFMNTHSSIPT